MSAARGTAERAPATGLPLLRLAVWFGLATGLSELAVLAVRRVALGAILNRGSDLVWMLPLADVLLLAAVGGGLAVASWRWPGRVTIRVAVFAYTFLGCFAVLFLFAPQLHRYAALVLALGLAFQLTRALGPRLDNFDPVRRRTLKGMVAVAGGLAAGDMAWRSWQERQALARLPAAPAGAPNVLLIVLDTVRAQNLSLHGYGRPTTPQLLQWARSGVRFDRAFSAAPWTLPSHASLFTGRHAHQLSANWMVPLDRTYPTLAELLRDRGYLTAGFVANKGYCSAEFGLNRGFLHYEDYLICPGELATAPALGRYVLESRRLRRLVGYHQTFGRKTACALTDAFLGWVSGYGDRPFFAFLNYYDAHGPYLPPPPYDRLFGLRPAGEYRPLAHPGEVSAEQRQAWIDGYDGSIAYLDAQLARLFDGLRRRGLLDNTLVVLTSDHGEEFGEHGVFDHGNSLYLPSVHVPLLISFPGRVPAGRVVTEPVSLREVAATVADLAGLAERSPFPGRSLARHWAATGAPAGGAGEALLAQVRHARNLPDFLPVSRGDLHALVVDGWRYIRAGDGGEELYDLDGDPGERTDLSRSARARSQLPLLRNLLDDLLAS